MGPVGIAQQATQAAKEGPAAFLTLMSMVSLNLAIMNLLPIPILDGAMILTLLIEMVMGRDISMNVKEAHAEGRLCVPDDADGVCAL